MVMGRIHVEPKESINKCEQFISYCCLTRGNATMNKRVAFKFA